MHPKLYTSSTKTSGTRTSETRGVRLAAHWVMQQRGRVQDGAPCMAAVDVKKCPFCEFHVAKEYKRMATVHRGGFRDSLLPTAFRASAQQQRSGGPPRMQLFLLPPCHMRPPPHSLPASPGHAPHRPRALLPRSAGGSGCSV